MTESELTCIDALLALPGLSANSAFDGRPIYCDSVHPEIEFHSEELRKAGFISYANLPDFRHRRPYEHSLWVRRADNRCVPELYALATIRYGRLTPVPGVQPYWTDKDWRNNNSSNVSVSLPRVSIVPPISSKYGVRAGTPEYWRKYYEDPANRAKQRAAAKKHAARKREEIRTAKQALEVAEGPDPLKDLRDRIMGEDGRRGDDDDRNFGHEED